MFTGSFLPVGQATAQTAAQSLFEQMTVEERVGQVFLVTFQGSKIEPDSQIVELIQPIRS